METPGGPLWKKVQGPGKLHAPRWAEPAVPQEVFLNPVTWGQGWGLVALKPGRALWMELGVPPGRSQPAGPVTSLPPDPRPGRVSQQGLWLFPLLSLFSGSPDIWKACWLTFLTAAAVLTPSANGALRTWLPLTSAGRPPRGWPPLRPAAPRVSSWPGVAGPGVDWSGEISCRPHSPEAAWLGSWGPHCTASGLGIC